MTKQTNVFRWLHISDIHQGMNQHDEKQKQAFRELLEHVSFQVSRFGAPDFLFVTGDVAQSGAAAQYRDVQQNLFEPLRKRLANPSLKILTVPGNHDLDRSEIDFEGIARNAYHKALAPDTTLPILQKRRTAMNLSFQAYTDWEKTITKSDGEHWLNRPNGARSCQPLPKKFPELWMVQINTAWTAWGEDGNKELDEQGLCCGRLMLAKAFSEIPEDAMCIVLGHHPITWLEKECQADMEAMLSKYRAIYLHGHMHLPDTSRGSRFNDYISVQGGAVYQAYNDNIEPNGVVWGEIDVATGMLGLYPVVRKDHSWKRVETLPGFQDAGGWDKRALPKRDGSVVPNAPWIDQRKNGPSKVKAPSTDKRKRLPAVMETDDFQTSVPTPPREPDPQPQISLPDGDQPILSLLDEFSGEVCGKTLSEGEFFAAATKLMNKDASLGLRLARCAYVLEIKSQPHLLHPILKDCLANLPQDARDFLTAHFVMSLLSKNIQQPRERLDILEVHSHVYPKRINRFCKLMIQNQKNQHHLLKSLLEIYEAVHKRKQRGENLKITRVTTNICYLMGRLTNKQVRHNARNALLKWDASIRSANGLPPLSLAADVNDDAFRKQKFKEQGYLEKSNADRLLYRTIQISLIELEVPNAAAAYIDLCLTSKTLDEFNRGFHLEYYGDIPYDPTQPMANRDELGPCDNTFRTLINKIEHSFSAHTPYCLRDIEIYTVVSLAQHRHAVGRLDESIRKQTLSMLERNPGISELASLRNYCSFVTEHLSQQDFRPRMLVKDIYALKKMPRAGWVSDGRNVQNPESIASHIAGGMWLIYFYLPRTASFEAREVGRGYARERVLQLFLVHDLAECRLGDLLPHQKTEAANSREYEFFRKMTHIGTYQGFANTSLLSDWEEFEYGQSTNARLARDIDKLENLQQLMIELKDPQSTIPDAQKWIEYLHQRLTTPEGKRIARLMLEQTIYAPIVGID